MIGPYRMESLAKTFLHPHLPPPDHPKPFLRPFRFYCHNLRHKNNNNNIRSVSIFRVAVECLHEKKRYFRNRRNILSVHFPGNRVAATTTKFKSHDHPSVVRPTAAGIFSCFVCGAKKMTENDEKVDEVVGRYGKEYSRLRRLTSNLDVIQQSVGISNLQISNAKRTSM